jgi:uncharacterized 2Fe-2S/4Fe-4S cluster protein (DUF4445 family)
MSAVLHLNHQACRAALGETVFECAERLGVRVPTSCRKQGRCRECVVEVTAGAEGLSARGPAERHLRGNYRLACCARVAAGAGEIRCHTLRRGELRIERQAFDLPGQGAARRLDPAVRRDGDRILLDGTEIARGPAPLHGLALDLGTTTVVLRLLDLETGEMRAEASFENPQRFGGSDVMARIQYDSEDGSRTLQRILASYLAHAIEEIPVDPQTIFEVVVAGNSTMRDLFFRLPVHSIGQSPYQSIIEQDVAAGRRTTTSLVERAARLGLPVHPRARAYGLPIVTGHVGADTSAGMLAIDLANEERLVAMMDIGTNTELVVGNRHRLIAASCPAGPAFEGGQIAFGMPGLPGAIEKVEIDAEGRFRTTVIGGGPAEGICGSGLVDLLGELLRTGRMNRLGRFEDEPDPLVVDARVEPPITFGEADINALAQAKGANVAGLQIAFREYGIRAADLDVFYLAGGFGRYLNLESARRIGLIPDIDPARIKQVGNTAIEGACLALLSQSRRVELEALARRVVHCRLETHPRFFDVFAEGCQFAPIGPSLELPRP